MTAKPNKAADGDRQAGNDRGAGSHWAEVVGDPVVQAESGGDAGQGCHVPNAKAGAKLARATVPGVGAVAVPELCPDHFFEVGRAGHLLQLGDVRFDLGVVMILSVIISSPDRVSASLPRL